MFTKNQLLEFFPIGNPIFDGRLFDPISAVLGGVGLVGSLIGGGIESSAASRAAKIQQQAAAAAGKQVTDAAAAVNPNILAAAKTAGTGAIDTAATAAGNATDAATKANNLLNPYITAGANASKTLDTGLQAGGDFNKTPGLSDLQIDPGYAFREQQGELALSRGAAARGAVQGGGFQKNINAFAQANASQEYQNAFNRFETSTQNRFANLKGVSDAGQGASVTAGGNLIGTTEYGGNLNLNAGEFAGTLNTNAANLTSANTLNAAGQSANYLTQGANAQASGIVGSANAWGQAISGGANSAVSPFILNKLINPTYGSGPTWEKPGGAPPQNYSNTGSYNTPGADGYGQGG